METFTKLKPFVDNPLFEEQREITLKRLDISTIDVPIIEIVNGLAKLHYCFPLQSCYGHFVYSNQKNSNNIDPLLCSDNSSIGYRIAYIALCIQNNNSGKVLFQKLREIPSIDPEYVQFGCAEWFWKRQVNSYALQVEPRRYMTKDRVSVNCQEALYIQEIRDKIFNRLKQLIQERL